MAYSSAPYQDQPEFLDDPDSGGTSLIVPNGILTRDAAGRGKMSTPGVNLHRETRDAIWVKCGMVVDTVAVPIASSGGSGGPASASEEPRYPQQLQVPMQQPPIVAGRMARLQVSQQQQQVQTAPMPATPAAASEPPVQVDATAIRADSNGTLVFWIPREQLHPDRGGQQTRVAVTDLKIDGTEGNGKYLYGINVYMANNTTDYSLYNQANRMARLNHDPSTTLGSSLHKFDGALKLGQSEPVSLLHGLSLPARSRGVDDTVCGDADGEDGSRGGGGGGGGGGGSNLAEFVFPWLADTSYQGITSYIENGVVRQGGDVRIMLWVEQGRDQIARQPMVDGVRPARMFTAQPVAACINRDLPYITATSQTGNPLVSMDEDGQAMLVNAELYETYLEEVRSLAIVANRTFAGGYLIFELIPWTEGRVFGSPSLTSHPVDPHSPLLRVSVTLSTFRFSGTTSSTQQQQQQLQMQQQQQHQSSHYQSMQQMPPPPLQYQQYTPSPLQQHYAQQQYPLPQYYPSQPQPGYPGHYPRRQT